MAPFNRPPCTPISLALYIIALSYIIFNLFDVGIVILQFGLQVTEGHRKWYRSKAWVWFLFSCRSNYGSVLYHFQDIARY